MSDIFSGAVTEARSFYLQSGVGVEVDSTSGELYVPSTLEAVATVMGLLSVEDREAIVDHVLATGVVTPERMVFDDRVWSLAELRDAIAAKAVHSAVQTDPEVKERVDQNRFEIEVAEMTQQF